MSDRKQKLTEVARETKNALYAEWKKKQCFEDYNKFYDAGRGVISEAMGLTSVMLMYVCFAKNKNVFDSINDPETKVMVESSLNFLYETIEQEGYTVSPLLELESTEGVIDKAHPYVDTLTWVLSSSVLTIYASREGYIQLDEDLQRKAIELMADSLAHLMNGQLDSGAWGFTTDKGAKQSLYFTYAVAASLADFLDYIFGELQASIEDESSKSPEYYYDRVIIEAINTYYRENPKDYYPKEDVTGCVLRMRSNLQKWLIENCLPILPKLAECTPLTDEEMLRIGMVRQTSAEKSASLGGKDYINLYYAYYIIDILTTSSSDKRFKEKITTGEDEITVDALKGVYKGVISTSDYEYFFEKNSGKNAKDLFDDYINQAIHSARTNFGTARRSGKAFWDSSASELIIPWEHNEIPRAKIEEARGKVEITEPALVPMALRANTVYCFYIIDRADVTVDNMFDMICEDRSPVTETVRRDTKVKNLWDQVNYSLPVTERAIEAIVDYSDYLKITAVEEKSEAGQSSALDLAIEKKIKSFILSDEGKDTIASLGYVRKDEIPAIDESRMMKMVDERASEIVENTIAQALANIKCGVSNDAVASSGVLDIDSLIFEIENAARCLMNSDQLPEHDSDNKSERLAREFVDLIKLAIIKIVQNAFSGLSNVSNEEAKQIMDALRKQINELVDLVSKNYRSVNGNLASIYRRMITTDQQ